MLEAISLEGACVSTGTVGTEAEADVVSSSHSYSYPYSSEVPVGEMKPDGKTPEAAYPDPDGKEPVGQIPDPVPAKVGNCDSELVDFGVLDGLLADDDERTGGIAEVNAALVDGSGVGAIEEDAAGLDAASAAAGVVGAALEAGVLGDLATGLSEMATLEGATLEAIELEEELVAAPVDGPLEIQAKEMALVVAEVVAI